MEKNAESHAWRAFRIFLIGLDYVFGHWEVSRMSFTLQSSNRTDTSFRRVSDEKCIHICIYDIEYFLNYYLDIPRRKEI